MAQVDTQNNPNDPSNPNNPTGPNQPDAQNQQTNQPATSGGAGAVTSTGAGNVTGQVVGTANPSQPFQNIASYLAANAPQSATLAGQVASSVSQPIAQTTSDIANASQGFTNSVNAGYTPENTSLVNEVATNPTAAAATPGNVSSFEQLLNDTYTGPTAIESTPTYTNLETEIANAQALGTNALTPTGIQTLLQSQETPDFTQGINNLDTLLLAQNPSNAQTIANAGLVANNSNDALQNFLTAQTTQDDAAAQAAEAQAAAAASGASGALNTAANNVVQPAETALASDLTGVENYNAALTALQNTIGTGDLGNLTPAQMAEIGYNPQDMTALNMYESILPTEAASNGINPSIYYSGPSTEELPSSIAQVETPEQAAAVAALQELNGGAPLSALNGLSSTAPTQPFAVNTNMGTYDNAHMAKQLLNYVYPIYSQLQEANSGNSFYGTTLAKLTPLENLLNTLSNPAGSTGGTGGGGGLGGV